MYVTVFSKKDFEHNTGPLVDQIKDTFQATVAS